MKNRKKMKLWIMALAICMLYSKAVYAKDAATVVLPTDVAQARPGCTLVGVQGSYAGDVTAAIARLNEIRLEACTNGYPDPRDSSRSLTPADYVPMHWSSDLEYIARIRAAEASVYTSHDRPNGPSWYDISSPNGLTTGNEVLAWQSWTGTLVDAIDNWYSEKETWVTGGNGVTGHYTNMIDPDYCYAGIATFNSDSGVWRSSSAGTFRSGEGLDETAGAAVSNCIQIIEVNSAYLGNVSLQEQTEEDDYDWDWDMDNQPDNAFKVGDSIKYDLVRDMVAESDKSQVYVLGNITWSTSDAGIASVDAYGAVTITGCGTVTITAASDTGLAASKTITVKSDLKKVKIKGITAGKKRFTVKWGKVSKATGYQIQYSTKRKFKSAVKTKVVKGKNKKALTVKKLKSGKTYYVRIRAYKKIKGSEYYSAWSKVKKVKVK